MAETSSSSQSTGIVLHHLENSRSQRILWLLEELGIPYTIKHYKRQNVVAPPELKKIFPLGKSPVITDGDLVLAESGAIVEYLITKYGNGRFQPPQEGWVHNLYFAHASEGSLMPLLTNMLVYSIAPSRAPFIVRPILSVAFNKLSDTLCKPQIATMAEHIEEHLSKSPSLWFAGGSDPTAADFMMLFPMEVLPRALGDNIGAKTKEWVKMVHARPTYQKALEKGGPYSYA